jgi:hypothetical protein
MLLGSPVYATSQICENYTEIRKAGHMSIGVNFDIPDLLIQQQFRYAMDFWTSLLDMDWHADGTAGCAIRVSFGFPNMFDSDDIAQADDPDSLNFRGEVVFNSAHALTPLEAYLVCIHEIGHLWGLDHNPSPTSVMYAVGIDGGEGLEAADISVLSTRHLMRQGIDTFHSLPVGFILAGETYHSFSSTTAKSIAFTQFP